MHAHTHMHTHKHMQIDSTIITQSSPPVYQIEKFPSTLEFSFRSKTPAESYESKAGFRVSTEDHSYPLV